MVISRVSPGPRVMQVLSNSRGYPGAGYFRLTLAGIAAVGQDESGAVGFAGRITRDGRVSSCGRGCRCPYGYRQGCFDNGVRNLPMRPMLQYGLPQLR